MQIIRKVVIEIKTNRVAGGGVSAALCVVVLFLASFVPNLTLAFLFASSLVIGVCLLRYRLSCTLACYVAASAVSLFLVPDKFVPLAFIALFGNYPIVKLYIEKIRNITAEYIVKLIVFNIYLFMAYVILKALGEQAFFDFSMTLLYFVGLVLLLFYDLVFGFVINAFYKSYYKYLK